MGMLYADYEDPFDDTFDQRDEEKSGIVRTGKLFGGLFQDIK